MQHYRCKCGESYSFGSMSPQDCQVCKVCGSTYAQHPDYHAEPQPHTWVTKYDQNTGKPYKWCNKCGHFDEKSYDLAQIKDLEDYPEGD
jgi:hypothetical protein